MKKSGIRVVFIGLFLMVVVQPLTKSCWAADVETLQKEIDALQQQIDELKADREDRDMENEEDEEGVNIGGALRYNYVLQDFSDSSETKFGDIGFDIFRLNVDGAYKDVLISAEYRWYSYQDVIHHGWVGYNFGDHWQGQLGVSRVPFGILPYASHNWWFAIPYYVGLEDDYDAGVKAIWDRDDWNLQLAFYKNGEWGNAAKLERYSFDVVSNTQSNEETNQFNVRLVHVFDHGSFGSTEVGGSGQWGQLYNSATDENGDHWAAAIHMNGYYGPFNVMLEALTYAYNPENPAGVSDDTIEFGAFAGSSLVASEANIYLAGISYDLPVSWGPISKLTFYNDYSIMVKQEDDFPDSQINTTGCLITAGPVYTYVDLILGKNAQYLDGGTDPFGPATGSDEDWHTRFNINLGYYF